MIPTIKHAWRAFTHDQPGQRFTNQYRRAQRRGSFTATLLRSTLGTVLIACGVLLWFLPGPGWLLVMFGMALLASESRRLAGYLDKTEMFMRTTSHRLRRWWRSTPETSS